MNKLKKLIGSTMLCAIISISMSVPAFAANTYTFVHGNNTSTYKCFAETQQTGASSTLGAQITWQVNGSNSVIYGPMSTGTGASVRSSSVALKGKKGKSYGYYYINGTKKHESTAWMDFSF